MRPRAENIISFAVLALLVFFVFGQVVGFQFVNYDDGIYVYQNNHITSGLSGRNLLWAFTHVHAANWHPLTTISHMLDCQLFGLKPGGPHAVNLALHLGTVMLLFCFLRLAAGDLWSAFVAAALFAVHPLRAESVAWVSERKDVLSGFFFFLTLLAYYRYARRSTLGDYSLVAISLAAGLMAKPMLVTTPLILLLLDYWPLRRARKWRHLIVEKIPLVLIVGGSIIATLLAQRLALGTTDNLPLAWRLNNAAISYFNYLRQMFWPVDLIPFYRHPESGIPEYQVIAAVIGLVALSLAALVFRKKLPWFPTGWFWYLVMLLPVIGVIQVGLQARADRYTYLPQIGIIIVVVWTGRLYLKSNFAFLIVAAVAITPLALIARAQTSHWHDTETLWKYTLSKTPESDVALTGLAGIQLVRGEIEQARQNYQRAVDLRPGNSAAQHGLAISLWKERKVDAAIAHWQKSLEGQPDNNEARDYLGTALAGVGRYAEAVQQWQTALRFDGDDGNAANNLAWILATSADKSIRDGKEAVRLAEHAVQLPGGENAIVYRTLAFAYARAGRLADAARAARHGSEIARAAHDPGQAAELDRLAGQFEADRPLPN